MTDEQALLAAIWEHPHDDTPRLIYADWLQETGDPVKVARAEFIRVQCGLARLAGDDPQFDTLESCESELLDRCQKLWWQQMPKGCRKGTFSRGFPTPSLAQFSIRGMVRLGEERLRAAPLWRYHYGVYAQDLDDLLSWRFLHRLELFALQAPAPDGWADRLAGCSGLRNVSDLSLMGCEVSASDITSLLDAWIDRQLTHITMKPGPDVLALLANHPVSTRLRTLDIGSFQLPLTSLRGLVKGQRFSNLIGLNIAWTGISDRGLTELLRWDGFRRLRRLNAINCGLTDRAVKELATSPQASSLRAVYLVMNQIGEQGAIALAQSPHVGPLTELFLNDNPLNQSQSAIRLLRDRFGKAVTF